MKNRFHRAAHVSHADPAQDRLKMAKLQTANIIAMALVGLRADTDDAGRKKLMENILAQTGQLDSIFNDIANDLDHKERKATLDALTGVYNRAYFDPALDTAITGVEVTGMPMTLMAFDIDHFKQVNDVHGHAAGDKVLKIFAQQIRKGVKEKDIVARIGGEEFMVILPDTTRAQAVRVARRLRESVAARKAEIGAPAVTVSIGIAEYRHGDTPAVLKNRADKALYEAKRQGRNRAVCAPGGRIRKSASLDKITP